MVHFSYSAKSVYFNVIYSTFADLEIGRRGSFLFVLLSVHLSMILDNDQIDTQLLYFAIRLL